MNRLVQGSMSHLARTEPHPLDNLGLGLFLVAAKMLGLMVWYLHDEIVAVRPSERP